MMALFDEIYSNIDPSNVQAPNKTGTGRFVLDTNPTITGATLTGGTITGATLTGGTITGATTLTGFTSGSILFAGVGGVISQDNAQLFWDNASNRLGVGTAAPVSKLHVAGGDLSVNSLFHIALDGGGDTYLVEGAPNVLNIVTGGVTSLQVTSALTRLLSTTTEFPATNGGLQSSGVLGLKFFDNEVNVKSGVLLLANTFNAGISFCAGNASMTSNGELLLPSINPPTANYGNRNSFIKGWAFINAAGALLDSYNVTSVAKGGVGQYTVSWGTDFATANYCVVITKFSTGTIQYQTKLAGSVIALSRDSAGLFQDSDFCMMSIGTQ